MAYATFGSGSDVFVFKTKKQSFVCFSCIMEKKDSEGNHIHYISGTAWQMLGHLYGHIKNGDRVPSAAILKLKDESHVRVQ